MEKRIGVSAALGSFASGIVLAIYEVQEWDMPAPLAVVLIVLMLLLVVVAVGVILYEVGKALWRIWQQRAVSATWVSTEEPGLLDFEADLERGTERFISEMEKLANDTRRLGRLLPKHQKRIQNAAESSNPRKKQKRANQAAKDIGQSAIFISRRKELLDSLVTEVYRNGKGILLATSLDQKEHVEAGRSLQKTLDESVDITKTTVASLSAYRDATKGLVDRNISRTIRIESNRLMEALDRMLKTLKRYNTNSQQLKNMLAKRIPPSQ